ncbi:MAG: cytochrome c [Planctomycetota bacterium]|nr:cytochrome c [Planctomycetota bacterium]MDP6838067.1 cytochrome c [Planctomycetota bacterium]MDP6955691.1 cytochrome c [Planctomycetota bacterium]
MDPRSRRLLLAMLVGAFCLQTWLIYSDPIGREHPPLSAAATRGRALYHSHNCQSCHQIFGFGGFLGPDLTNLARRRGDTESLARDLTQILTTGSERMPAFKLSDGERSDLASFFTELDRLGVGQVRITETPPAKDIFKTLIAEYAQHDPLTPEAAEGLWLVEQAGCINCHLPNGRSTFAATDLTKLHSQLSEDQLRSVLTEGIPEKGMPAMKLQPTQFESLLAFLAWLDRQGPDLRQGFHDAENASGGSLLDLPWFEYR